MTFRLMGTAVLFLAHAPALFAVTPLLFSSANPSVYGKPLTLTATVTTGSTGKVTFYDGTTILGVGTVSGGQALLTTRALHSGVRSLRAYYRGDASNAAGSSTALSQTVNTAISAGPTVLSRYAVSNTVANPVVPLIAADFNGDGVTDIAAVAALGVRILSGNSDGTFQPAISVFARTGIWALSSGDFNEDGIVDLAVLSSPGGLGTAAVITILLGNGDGSFQPSGTTQLPNTVFGAASGQDGQILAVADFNGDGKADLAVMANVCSAPCTPFTSQLSILPGNGDGTFQAAVNTALPQQNVAFVITAGDFNGDGKPDLVVGGTQTPGLGVLLGNGDGTFQPLTFRGSPNAGGSLATADINGDGKLDVVSGNGIAAWLGNGDGTFVTAGGPYGAAYSSVAEDVDGDTKPDIAATFPGLPTVAVFRGAGSGFFPPAIKFPVGTGFGSYGSFGGLVAADFNGDGRVDFAALTPQGIDVLLGDAQSGLYITASHNGSFVAGQTQTGSYAIYISAGLQPLTGPVTVTDTLPSGFTAISISGSGWTCTLSTVSCTRSDGLAIAGAYPPITVLVSLSSFLPALTVNNQVTATANGIVSTASDPTVVLVVGPVTPDSGTGFTQTFTASYSYSEGYTNFQAVYLLLTFPATNVANACFVEYNPATDALFLRNDANTAWLGPVTLGAGSLNNSQCTLNSAAATASGAANTLTVTFPLTFSPTFSKPQKIFLNAVAGQQVSGFIQAGAWTPGTPLLTPSVSLATSGSPSRIGTPVTLTATVTAGATGKVTFFDGPDILGYATLSGGVAQITTRLQHSGVRQLRAVYRGDSSYYPASSPIVKQTVTTVPLAGFLPAIHNPTGAAASSAVASTVAADFNGDGITDLAVATQYTVLIYPGKGDGTFSSPATVFTAPAVNSEAVRGLIAGDFNEDGKTDLAVYAITAANFPSATSGGISILLGNGDGAFTAGAQLPVPSYESPLDYPHHNLVVADFNNDGKADLALAGSFQGPPSVALLYWLGNGDGTFQQQPVNLTSAGFASVNAADLNGDGNMDLVLAPSGLGTLASVTILLGNGDGSFQQAFGVPSAVGGGAVSIADVNGDGKPDIVTGSPVRVFLGNGDGTFPASTPSVPSPVGTFVIEDLNGDGIPDVAASQANISMLLGNGDGTLQPAVILQTDRTAGQLVAADFNGDGRIDFAVIDSSGLSLDVYLGYTQSNLNVPTPLTGFPSGHPAQLMLVPANGGFQPIAGPVSVTYTLPTSITAISMSGSGWTCDVAALTCSRPDGLAAGAQYPSITLTILPAPSANGYYNTQAIGIVNGIQTLTPGTISVTSPTTWPTITGIIPSAGAGTRQIFTVSAGEISGYTAIATVDILFSSSVYNGANACLAEYTASSNSFTLLNAAGSAWLGPLTAGSNGTLSNGICTLSGSGASATGSVDILSVNFPITFTSLASNADSNIYLRATDVNGVTTGFVPLGSWTSFGVPRPVSLSPDSGSGTGRIFSAVFNHSGGASQNYLEYFLALPTPSPVNYTAQGSCLVEYNVISNGWRLVNDAGTGWLGGASGATTGTLSNSVCSLNISSSSAQLSGSTLTVNYVVTFNSAFTGTLATFLQELDINGQWAGVTQFGNWTAFAGSAKPGPSAAPVTPATGSGTSGTFTSVISHSSGLSSIYFATMLFSSTLVGSPACQVYYFPASNTLNLINDAGTGFVSTAGVAPGTAFTALSNSRCSLTAGTVTASGSTSATLSVNLTFNAANFSGSKNVYVQAFDTGGLTTHWVGGATWSVQ